MAGVEVSDTVRGVAMAQGPAGERWLAELEGVVATVAERWRLSVGDRLEGGTASWVAEVVRADGSPAVLKVALPLGEHGDPRHEIRVLQLAAGRGCVRLLDHDVAAGALLMERLGGRLHDQGLAVREQIDVICSAVSQMWTSSAAGTGLPTLAAKAPWLAEVTEQWWADLDRPCPRPVVDRSLRYVERRLAAYDASGEVLCHGDAHPWNTLVDPAGGYRLVDPDGLLAEPEYDLAIVMRELTDELLAGDPLALGLDRARYLAHRTGLDADRIWEWGYVERLSTGLMCLRDGLQAEGQAFLQVAEAWSAAPD